MTVRFGKINKEISAVRLKLTVVLITVIAAVLVLLCLSPKVMAYDLHLGESEYIMEGAGGVLIVDGSRGLIDLSNVSPDEYQSRTIQVRQTSNESEFYDMTLGNYTRSFLGLGNEDYPFEGTIDYNLGSRLPFKADRALFNYISTDAVLYGGIELVPDSGADQHVLADHVTAGDGAASWSVAYYQESGVNSYTNAGLIGSVEENAEADISLELDDLTASMNISSTGSAGLVFGTVGSGAQATVDLGSTIPVTTVSAGGNAGLIAGRVDGVLDVEDMPSSVSSSFSVAGGTSAGLITGYLSSGSSVSVDSGITTAASITVSGSDGGSAGGLVGYMDNAELSLGGNCTVNGSVSSSQGNSSVGGVIGYADSSSVTVANSGTLTVAASITSGGTEGSDTVGCGGYIGTAVYDSTTTIDVSNILVSGTTFGGSGAQYSGGLFGVLHTEGSSTALTVTATGAQNTVSTSCSNPSTAAYYGGIIGYYSAEAMGDSLTVTGITAASSISAGDQYGSYTQKTYGGVIACLKNDKAYVDVHDVTVSTNFANNARSASCTGVYGGVVGKGINSTEGTYGLLNVGDVTVSLTRGNPPVTSGQYGSFDNYDKYSANGTIYEYSFGGVVGTTGNLAVRLHDTTDLSDLWKFGGTSGKRNNAIIAGNNTGGLVYACGNGTTSGWVLKRPASDAYPAYASDLGAYGEVIRMTSSMSESDIFTFDQSAHTLTLKAVPSSLSDQKDFAIYSIAADCASADSAGALRLTSAADLSANLSLSADISLAGTGLTALSYTDTFTGTFNGGNHTITLATGEPYGLRNNAAVTSATPGSGQIYYHQYSGLFSQLAGNVSNLNIGGTMELVAVENAGSLAGIFTGQSNTISGCTVSTSINDTYANDSYFNPGRVDQYHHQWEHYVGGMIGKASNSTLTFSNITLSDSLTVTNPAGADAGAGGLLANTFDNCNVTLTGITVSGAAIDTGDLSFGTLVYDATGKMHVTGINFGGSASSIEGTSKSAETSSLVVCKGDNLYFILDPNALTVTTQPTVTLTGMSYFDELVGNSISSGANGIVSIETGNTGHLDDVSLNSYTNRLTTLYDNPNTRYYYDLYDICGLSGRDLRANGSTVIDSPEDMMAFDAWCYAAPSLKRNFVPVTQGAWKITGNIDLSGYSYYPVDLTSGMVIDDATIKLDYENYYTTEAQNRQPYNGLRQHYMLHASLFNNVSSSLTVDDLTLQGTGGYIGGNSGVLAFGSVYGSALQQCNVSITDLDLDNLRIIYSGSTVPGYAPLLINNIRSYTNLEIDGLSTENYSAGDVASSLMGNAGLDGDGVADGRKISLSFSGIKLDGRTYNPANSSWTVDSTSYTYNPNGSYTGPLFTKATLMNAFYADDDSTCRGIYNFDEDEPVVTYGTEISYTSSGRQQYWYYDTFNTGDYVWDRTKTGCGDTSDNTNDTTYFLTGYLPYVFVVQNTTDKTIDLRVNQASSVAAEGCGTYGHPYVITSDVSWFYNVASFLNSNIDIELTVNKNVLDAEAFVTSDYHTDDGNQNDIKLKYASGTWTVTGGTYTVSNQAEMTQKVRRYLANAYYLFDDSNGAIVLTIGDTNNFYGLGGASANVGSGSLAFAGVLAGDRFTGTNITINFASGAASKHCGGLVKYANGCVIKNLSLNFTGSYTVDIDNTYLSSSVPDYVFFGGAIGYVIGGDNIIDSVFTNYSNATISVADCDYSQLAGIGGYAGLVGGVISQKATSYTYGSDSDIGFTAGGGIVFRNMAAATGLGSVTFDNNTVITTSDYSTASGAQNYLYWNPYIGRVYDGYACYDTMTSGSGTSSSVILDNTDKDYDIPTICNTSTPGISVAHRSEDNDGGGRTYDLGININNEQGLWLLSSIVNSGAGVHYRGKTNNDGTMNPSKLVKSEVPDAAYVYGKARSTRATYDYIGTSLTAEQIANECYNEKAWSGRSGMDIDGKAQISYLVDKSGGGDIIATLAYDSNKRGPYRTGQTRGYSNEFYLTADIDMTSYGSGFRGIGYSYSTDGIADKQSGAQEGYQSFGRNICFNYFGSSDSTKTDSDTVRTVTLNMDRHEYTSERFYMLGEGLVTTLTGNEVNNAEYYINALCLSGSVSYSSWDFTNGTEAPPTDNNNAIGGFFSKCAVSKNNTTVVTFRFIRTFLEELEVTGGRYTGGLGGNAGGTNYDFSDYKGNRIFIIQDCGYSDIHISSNGFAGGLFGFAAFFQNSENLTTLLTQRSAVIGGSFEDSLIESDFTCSHFKINTSNRSENTEMCAGGLIGFIYSNGPIRFEDTDILNVTVQATNTGLASADFTTFAGNLGGVVGGMEIGNGTYMLAFLGTRVEGCTIGHQQNGAGGGANQFLAYNCGGLLGKGRQKGILTQKSNTRNNIIKDNIIRWGVNLGGAVGFMNNNGGGTSAYRDIVLDGNMIYVDYASLLANGQYQSSTSAGLIGRDEWNNPPLSHITVTNCKIIGICTGGLFGFYNDRAMNASDISISDSYIATSFKTEYNAWENTGVPPRTGGIAGYANNVATFNLFDIRLSDAIIGELLDNTTQAQRSSGEFTACDSFDSNFVTSFDENNVGLNERTVYTQRSAILRSYPWLATHTPQGILTSDPSESCLTEAHANALTNYGFSTEIQRNGVVAGKAAANPVLNITGLYMHSDQHYWPYIFLPTNSGIAPNENYHLVYADYSGLQNYYDDVSYMARTAVNPHKMLPGNVDLFGNFIGSELANIYTDTRTAVIDGNYRDCYRNAATQSFTETVTEENGPVTTTYNTMDFFLNQAGPDNTGILGQYYISTYRTVETTTELPAASDFPVLVISSDAANTVDDVLKSLICTLTNTTSFTGTAELTTYAYNPSTEVFAVKENANSLAYTDGAFSLTDYHNTNNDTFLRLRIKYQDPTDATNYMNLDIPVKVSKMMEFSLKLQILNGTSYIPSDYTPSEALIMSDHGDSITAIFEYNYMRDVETWNNDIEKGVNLNWNYDKSVYLGQQSLPAGTQFILVDCTKGGREYYYTVGANESVNMLDFSDFTDGTANPTAWAPTPISELLGLTVSEASDNDGKYDLWSSQDEDPATISVNGVLYKYNEEGTGTCNILMGDDRVNGSNYLLKPERYYLTIRTPETETQTKNNLMSYGNSSSLTPLTCSTTDNYIATKGDRDASHISQRYLLNNSFDQNVGITTAAPEDMIDQTEVHATLVCDIPPVAAANGTQFDAFNGYLAGTNRMYQEFELSLLEYDAAGNAVPCNITANSVSWSYRLQDADDNDVDTAAALLALAVENGFSAGTGITQADAEAIMSNMDTVHQQTLSGSNPTVAIQYGYIGDTPITNGYFDSLIHFLGKKGFKLVADVTLTYDTASRNAQFPNRVTTDDEDESGVAFSVWNKIAFTREALDYTSFISGAADTGHRFYISTETEAPSKARLEMNVADVQILSGNAFEVTSFDISATGVYDYSMVGETALAQATQIRYSVVLLAKDVDANRTIPTYHAVQRPDLYLTETGITMTRGNSTVSLTRSGDTYSYTFNNFTPTDLATDSVSIACSPITGSVFESRNYQYGNYRIQLKADLLDASGNVIPSTYASDYIVYTNAIIATDFLN